MAIHINNNLQSLRAQRHTNKTQLATAKSLEKLSSGSRINRAADDAAGLALSEKLRANLRALDQASQNVSSGISMIQTAEGALGGVNDTLSRMKELATQSANGMLGDDERSALNQEFQALREELDSVAENTTYNETNLLDGSMNQEIQVGIDSESADTVNMSAGSVSADDLSVATDISTAENAQAAMASIDQAMESVSSQRAGLGAVQNRLESVISNVDTAVENVTGAESRIRDVDMAKETAELTKYQILTEMEAAVMTQANQSKKHALSLLG